LLHVRRLTLVFLIALVAAPAAAASGIRGEKQRQRAVRTQVATINAHLDAVVQRWDGERVRLTSLQASLHENERVLRIARGNLHVAQGELEQLLYDEYVHPAPRSLEVLVGASSITDLIDKVEAAHAVASQDAAIAAEAQHLKDVVIRHEVVLRRERRGVVRTIAQLAAQRTAISSELAREQRLLASIHQTIQTLTAQAAARQRARAEAAREAVARRVASAQARAAAAAITYPQPVVAQDPAPTTTPTTQAPPPPPSVPAPPAPAPGAHAEAAAIAARYLGVPYVWGGESPVGFDCSGLVSYVYAQLGISLPHYTVSQWDVTEPIPTSDLEPGDLVFFDGLSHVGVYIGGGQFIHAPHTGTVVQISSLSGYWAANLDGARRVP
jgi:peptidoglycan DL-endopeptidase CwlO